MDNLLLDLIGKPILNPPAVVTVVAENFSFLEDQARFLRAALAIPEVKKLPFPKEKLSKRLIQIGVVHQEVREQLSKPKAEWVVHQYDSVEKGFCDQLESDLKVKNTRSLIYINDVSRIELATETNECLQLLKLVHKLKFAHGHFVILLYQTSSGSSGSKFLRNLEYISDASVRVKSCKAGYFKSIWWQTIPKSRSLIPAKIETCYYTCKIGKFYWSSDLLCFYEKRMVAKNHDINKDSYLEEETEVHAVDENAISGMLSQNELEDYSGTREEKDSSVLLPYTKAQDPEKSRIFYYPDKEDDIDENDPDNDLAF